MSEISFPNEPNENDCRKRSNRNEPNEQRRDRNRWLKGCDRSASIPMRSRERAVLWSVLLNCGSVWPINLKRNSDIIANRFQSFS